MRKYITLMAIAAMFFSSCAKELAPTVDAGEFVTEIKAGFADGKSKTVLSENGTTVLWNPQDEINVFFNSSSVKFTSINTKPDDWAIFQSSSALIFGGNETSGKSYLWGTYPYSADNCCDGETVTITIPAIQTALEGSFGRGTFPSVGRSKTTDIAFYNVCGGVRFTLCQSGIRKIVLRGNNNETLAGKVKVQFDENNHPIVSAVVNGEKSITLVAPDNGEFQTGKWYYISILPTTFSKSGFSVEFIKRTDESERGTKNVTSAVELKRSIFGSIEKIDDGVSIRSIVVPEIPEVQVNDGDYTITDGKISYKVLRNYLSRAITEAEYLNSAGLNTDGYYGTADDKRMLLNVGAKFVGRALYTWNGEAKFNNSQWLANAKSKIDAIHRVDPDVIFQAAIFETVSKAGVEQVSIPSWVFEAFKKTPETRCFKYEDIMNKNGRYKDMWGSGTCVPDMSREEAQMWFYYVAVRYMEAGIEALHMGQIHLMCSMGDSDNGYSGWRKMQGLIREAAKTKARRGIVLMDAHCNGIAVNGKHLFDFVSYPLRLKELAGSAKMEANLSKGYIDSILGKTIAGTTPSGWYASRLPYLLEFDNCGTSAHPGQAADDIFVWGYDEISWIGLVSEDYAKQAVTDFVSYMEKTDPVGYIQMPGCRIAVSKGVKGFSPYRCNTYSVQCPTGRNLETKIKDLWK